MGRCRVPGCKGATEFEGSAQAVLCTTCGTVANGDVLSHDEISGSSLYFGPTTLKSLRRVGGGLVGQSNQEDRDRRYMTAMDQFIVTTLTRLSCAGLAPRARTLFEQAKSRHNYRWGKTSVLVAGACIIIVLRENKKSALFTHVASLMDVSPTALCRKFTYLCTLLNIEVPPFEPLSLLPTLQAYVAALVNSTNSLLPRALVEILKPLSPASVLRLASSLAALISQLEEFSSYLGASVCPMACAIFILALEGQAASSLPSYPVLAKELGAKVGATKHLVTCHYRDISKVLEQWLTDVPWLIGPNHPDNIMGKKRRKSSQRDMIAMGMKDIVQFRENIQLSRRSRQMASPYSTALEYAKDSDDSTSADELLQSTDGSGRKRKRSEDVEPSRCSRALRPTRPARCKPLLTQVDLASLSLLSPMHLSADYSNRRMVEGPNDDILQRILTSSTFPGACRPTRLQLLVEARGGEDKITDDELFGVDELESLIRDEDEVQKLQHILGWNGSEPAEKVFSKSSLPGDQDGIDPTFWENIGSNKDDIDAELSSDEHIIGQWREASPFADKTIGDADNFDVMGEW
ncbi:hypothetical protein BU17DRAFT_39675 [Hysterangium stoloniferum]|nr:hypothetical protein BU17DRAFT_39675 [Hysterangium stoloniferum]